LRTFELVALCPAAPISCAPGSSASLVSFFHCGQASLRDAGHQGALWRRP
jgi:hypothetical protein